ncbi:LytTR family DNA-binding domain-containing protein [Chitinophaga nivalis]|uniref:DNA-binding protein n=1 Tax=Chitinophaga nivalis TaxID=2991709 RepID=A0ABT3IHD0_9BACT|nr:DNA-binding protein [Chitinophaga nivalis]MCW3466952.1 DNA-binding protein [Chitinophaga nivalis]MCW3483357.1 DNA-binding protein [Chitinophaga nivalis]
MRSLYTLPAITRYALEQPRFTLLDSVANRVALITFCSVFSFLFMYIFLPFNINIWYEGQQLTLAQLFLLFTLCGVGALTVSQFWLFRLKWRQKLTNATYLCWFLGEMVLIAFLVTLLDVMLIDKFLLTWTEFFNTLRYTALIMPLPYLIALLWFYTREKCAQLRQLETVVPEEKTAVQHACVQICDEHNRPVLTLLPAKLLLIRAEDNYVHVFYLSGHTICKQLVRTSLKKLETQLSEEGFTRAHRSYLINMSKVVLFKKGTKGYFLQLEGLEEMEVPVSASCLPVFQERFAPTG